SQIDRVLQVPAVQSVEASTALGTVPLRRPLNIEERDLIASIPSEARELLIAASDDSNGAVFTAESMQGVSISANGREFTDVGKPRSEAKWRRATQQLQELGLIEYRGGDGSMLFVTDEGFRVADLLRTDA